MVIIAWLAYSKSPIIDEYFCYLKAKEVYNFYLNIVAFDNN